MYDTSADAERVREGDLVLLILDERRRAVVRAAGDVPVGTDKGLIERGAIIGAPYGSAVRTSRGATVHVMRPLRHDYQLAVERTTQVIYPKDAALMIFLSGIGPSSRVGEGGVGTGLFAAFVASFLSRDGRLYSYDVDESALEVARRNLERLGLIDRVVLKRADVRCCVEERGLDAFFLDIPDPWEAVGQVRQALRPSAPLLALVPTVKQAERLVSELRSQAFVDVRVMELLLREWKTEPYLRPRDRMVGHTGFIVFARKTA
ncbi:MAG: tRNA (adenine-N1)-methyltransferase [Desulfurococcaceae archaeon]